MSGFGRIFPGISMSTPSPLPPAPKPVAPTPVPAGGEVPTPWVTWFLDRTGWTEVDHDRELSLGWKYVGLDYKTVQGADHAWCAMAMNTALIESGYKGNGSAAAASFQTYGTPCDFVFGAIIPIRHKDGSHHVTLFSHWIDREGHIAACIGGNQGNRICVAEYNLSGNSAGHDQCVSGPRWPVKSK